MDRWSIVTTLNYLAHDEEVEIVLAKAHHYRNQEGRDIVNEGPAILQAAARFCTPRPE